MRIFRGIHHPGLAPACALTIGNFDGAHRGHQAMLALLQNEARQRGVPSCVMTFEPHPRDFFASQLNKPEMAPARIATLRDKLAELQACGIAQCVVLPFNQSLAALSPDDFVQQMLVQGLGVRYVLVGDDFCYGAKRAGDYASLSRSGRELGFEVARMNSYEISEPPSADKPGVTGVRVSSSAVRQALAMGDMRQAALLLGRPYALSGHVVHGRKLGRELNCRTLNIRFAHDKPAASGIFVALVHGLSDKPLPGVANFGVRPSIDANDVNGGRVLLETHCLQWPAALGAEGGYGKLVRVELLHKLHDELKYDSMDALNQGIQRDCDDARAWLAARI
jgi:riboflavin kinase / FMN adenylyltransferase